MKALIDSHAFLWALEGSSRLGSGARTLLDSPDNELYLSLVSIWELAIKTSAGKLDLPQPASRYLEREAATRNVILLPLRIAHMQQMELLPFYHRDPFDRMLVAQAMVEDLVLLTVDRQLARYGVRIIW